MKKLIFLFLLNSIIIISLAQTNSIDKHLEDIYKTKTAKDRFEKIKKILEDDDLYDSLFLPLSNQLIEISHKKNYKILDSYLSKARVFTRLNIYDSANNILQKLIPKAKKEANNTIVLKSYLLLYRIFLNNNSYKDYMDSIEYYVNRVKDSTLYADMILYQSYHSYYQGKTTPIVPKIIQSINIYRNKQNGIKEMKAEAFLALVYQRMGEYEKAKSVYAELLKKDSILSDFEKSRIELEFGGLLMKFGQTEEAKELALSSLSRMKKAKNTYGISNAYVFLSYISGNIGNEDDVIHYSEQGLPYVKAIKDIFLLATVYDNIGTAYNVKQNYDSAFFYYKRMRSILNKIKDPSLLTEYYLNMAHIYASKKINFLAKQYYDSAYNTIKQGKNLTLLLNYYPAIIDYYKNNKNWKEATIYLEKYHSISDSLRDISTQEKINELKVEYETAKKEKRILLLSKQKEKEARQKKKILFLWITTSVAFLTLLIIFILFWKNVKHRRALTKAKNEQLEKDNQLKEQEKLRLEQEKKLLKSQKEITDQKIQNQNSILASINNSLFQQSQLTSFLIGALKGIRPYSNKEGNKKIKSYLADIGEYSKEKNWQTFEKNFLLLYPNFFKELKRSYPDLTTSEVKLCAFTKMNFSIPAISNITLQSKNSLYVMKTRLKTKMKFEDMNEFESFVKNLD